MTFHSLTSNLPRLLRMGKCFKIVGIIFPVNVPNVFQKSDLNFI